MEGQPMFNQTEDIDLLFNDLKTYQKDLEKREKKLYNQFNKVVERWEREKKLIKSRNIRDKERNTKKITSIAIHKKNQQLIRRLQKEAREDGFFLSKENIINMGLEVLNKECSGGGASVVDLFQEYNK